MKNTALAAAVLIFSIFGILSEARAQAEVKLSLPFITPGGDFTDDMSLDSKLGYFELELTTKVVNSFHINALIGWNSNETIVHVQDNNENFFFQSEISEIYYHVGTQFIFENGFGNSKGIHPYFGLIFGNVSFNQEIILESQNNNFLPIDSEASDLYLGFNFGIMYEIIPDLNFDLRYRFFITTDYNYSQSAIRLGIGYRFMK
ncbi:MAG: outer membrane beta-barrel protein [Candidatus Kapaibacterium sp.]